MSRALNLVAHVGRKQLVRSLFLDSEVDAPTFFRDDEVLIVATLVNDLADPTAEQPFATVDTAGWDLRVAIGNGISGTGRVLLAQTISFTRNTDGTFQGLLSLRTQAARDYLAFPDAYAPGSTYAAGNAVYFEGGTYRATTSVAAGQSPSLNPEKWEQYEIARDALYLEITLVRPEGVETLVQAPCEVRDRVIQTPPVSPVLIENPDALADAMSGRLADSASVVWDRNRDAHLGGQPAAQTHDAALAWPYLTRVWHPATQRYYQAVREIKRPIQLAALYDITLDHLPGVIDGEVPVAFEAFGAFNNINPATNGVYVVQPSGSDLKGSNPVFNVALSGGIGGYDVAVTAGKLYFLELANGESAVSGFTTITGEPNASATIQAATSVLRIRGSYGAPVRSMVRIAAGVRHPDALAPAQLPLGTVVQVKAGALNANKRFALSSVVTEVGVSFQTWVNVPGGSGAIAPTELAFFAEAKPAYSAVAYNAGTAYVVGELYQSNGRTFAAHTAATGQAPESRAWSGEVLVFNPSTRLVASARIEEDGGLKVTPRGLAVDMDVVAPDTYTVANQTAMLALPAKKGDYVIRKDLGDRPFVLRGSPASTLANWVSLDGEVTEASNAIETVARYRALGVGKIQTQGSHGLWSGNEVTITGMGGSGYNLTRVTIQVFAADEITFPSPGSDEGWTADTGGQIVQLIPVVTRPVTLTSELPEPITVGAGGTPGVGQRAAREDHAHPAPGLASSEADGFMSREHFALLQGMAGDAGPEVGFDGEVNALLVESGRVWVGGAFTRYGTSARGKLAALDERGRLDPVFNPLDGFVQPIVHLARTSDGDIVAGSEVVNNYRGLTGGAIWKLQSDGEPRAGWNCPIPLATTGAGPLKGLATSGNQIIAITAQTLRVMSATGSSVVTGTCNATLYDVAGQDMHTFWVSSSAYVASAGEVLVNGLVLPRGLKLLGAHSSEDCPCLAGQLVPEFASGAGQGANASMTRMAIGREYDGDFAIVATPRTATTDNGVDHAWNGGNALRYQGLYKIRQDGLADETFEVDLTLSEAGASAIPFAVDSTGRVYLGGPVSAINGTAVTPWRLYRLAPNGELDQEFAAFNDRVLVARLLDDDNIVVGGRFTKYGTRPAGRITFLNAAGSVTLPNLTAARGSIVTRTTLPDVGANPNSRFDLIRIPPQSPEETVSLWIHDEFLGWTDVCSICRIRSDSLPAVDFTPPSGTSIGGGLSIALRVPGFSMATIRYTTDGSTPGLSSPVYTTPIAVSSATTIKAYASLPSGSKDGPLSVAQYGTLSIPQLPPPQFSPLSGEPPITVTITAPEPNSDAVIHFTLDGTPATQASDVYAGPINITAATTIRAIAVKTGFMASNEAASAYLPSVVPASPAGQLSYGTSQDHLTLWIPGATASASQAGVYLEYRINGGAWTIARDLSGRPTSNYTLKLRQGSGLVYGSSVTIYARSKHPNGNVSVGSVYQYTRSVSAPDIGIS